MIKPVPTRRSVSRLLPESPALNVRFRLQKTSRCVALIDDQRHAQNSGKPFADR